MARTAEEVAAGIDLSGRVALVTGGAGGLGFETARVLAGAGARVIVAARSTDRAADGVARLREAVPGAAVEAQVCDLGSLASVRDCAAQVAARHDALHLLVNNAGVMACPLDRTADGFELQFGTNHLGHFLLTVLLAPLLVAGAPARVVTLSSAGHTASDVDLGDPNYERRAYDKWQAYGQSKTANILFTVELERRLAACGVHAYAVHPGMVRTELGRHMSREDVAALAERARSSPAGGLPRMLGVPEGAATSVWAAVTPGLEPSGGRYLADCAVSDAHAPWALDPDRAAMLWALSERLTGATLTV